MCYSINPTTLPLIEQFKNKLQLFAYCLQSNNKLKIQFIVIVMVHFLSFPWKGLSVLHSFHDRTFCRSLFCFSTINMTDGRHFV